MQKFAEKLKNIKASFQSNESGFTLIELIVVMAILAILVLLAAPQFLGYTKDARATSVIQDSKVLSDAAILYNVDHEGAWPTADEITDEVVTVALDPAEFADYVKNIDGEFTDYELVVNDGTHDASGLEVKEGDVVATEATEDRDGNQVFGATAIVESE